MLHRDHDYFTVVARREVDMEDPFELGLVVTAYCRTVGS